MSQTPTPRDVRQMVRESRRLVRDVSDCHRETSDVRDDYIKHLEARCELQEKALKESKKLVDLYEKQRGEREQTQILLLHYEKTINDLCKDIETQNEHLAKHRRILLRARHLEVHVEHRSLDHPPIPDAKLPELDWNDHWYFKNMQWGGVTEEEAEKVWEVAKWHYDNAVHTEDYRIPDVQAFVEGRPIPHPKKIRRNHYWNADWLSIIPRHPRFCTPSPEPEAPTLVPDARGKEPAPTPDQDATPEDESSDDDEEYWLESQRQQQGDGSGPSSARG
jgi:hypothetical protein